MRPFEITNRAQVPQSWSLFSYLLFSISQLEASMLIIWTVPQMHALMGNSLNSHSPVPSIRTCPRFRVPLSISICLLILRVKLFGSVSRAIKNPELSSWHANSMPPTTMTPGTIYGEESNNPNSGLSLPSWGRSRLSERFSHSQESVHGHEAGA